ncbi:hypothetical protein A3C37_01125 [Candidatus Peribacteria bacterium RIFCSPHIGHO2_02_FULL_53_20]|nr:MAG: hypothetical protein A3C37_01125 [Candidatus Peribacteria bacterium RIFCSPHIGHO2_02_FULL_53_20]OGJ72177.1 MAG: hypothetical protein A3G69_04555 [Candidatus Peribacteria bacterium RIFCSPLOWO2_12_FULL_53_10]
MEQLLTTAALIAGGIFAVWILFADPGEEEGKGEMNMAMLGALFMIPVIILLIIGIVLFLPILLGIALVVLLVYAAYQAVRWFLTREREEKPERKGEGRTRKMIQDTIERMKSSSRSVLDSRPVRVFRERTKFVTVRTRKAIAETGKLFKERTKRTTQRIREGGFKRVQETMRRVRSSDPRNGNMRKSVGEVFRKSKERAVRVRESLRLHTHDPLGNMRKIGWNTRKHLGEVYHHRKK